MSCCRDSCGIADEVREAFNTDDIDNVDGTHNIHHTPMIMIATAVALPRFLLGSYLSFCRACLRDAGPRRVR